MIRRLLLVPPLALLPCAVPALAQTASIDVARTSMVGIVAAAWLAFAVWAVIRASRMREQVEAAKAWGARLRGLLATAPGAYMVADGNGTLTVSDQLRGWLGLDRSPQILDDLVGSDNSGLVAEDFRLLAREMQALAMTGTPFMLPVRVRGSGRTLIASAAVAPPEVSGERGSVVWFTDATETVSGMQSLIADNSRLQRALVQAEDLVGAAPFATWCRNSALRLVRANQAYVRIVEAEDAESVVAGQIELEGGAQARTAIASAQRALETGQAQLREDVVIVAGERRHMQIHDVPLANSAAVAGFALDVTERVDAHAERERLQRAQMQTLDRLSAGVARFAADHALVFHNRAFAELFRLDDDWLGERPEFDRVVERMRESQRIPEQRNFPEWRRERRNWFTDATAPVEETWALPDNTIIRVIAQPHPEGGLLMIFEDRTEQLRLASARDTLLRVHEATLNNLHEAVAVFGADGRLQLCNARFAELLELSADQLALRSHVDDLAWGADDRRQLLRDVVHAVTVERQPRTGRQNLADGRALDYAAVPLPDGNMLCTWLDVSDSIRIETALRERAEALEAADKLKSAFVANMSYELRTPLTAISGFAEMLAQGYGGELNERQREYIGSIVASATRLQLLIDDILDLAVSEAGGVVLDLRQVSVEALVVMVEAALREQADSKQITLDVRIDASAGQVQGDERRLRQSLYNIVGNAVRFTEPGGRVSIEATGTAAEVRLVVRDTGVGLPREELEAVFERFRKGSNSGDRSGLGLGLSLVKQFIALHHGAVEIDSDVGRGTTVTIVLPRRPVARAA